MARRPTEIERKWLVKEDPDLSPHNQVTISQGYLCVSDKGAEVRLRREGKRFFQTVKTGAGLQRGEFEIELSKDQFKRLWPATRGRRLQKVRYSLKWRGKVIELDSYRKKLAGLKVAEVEFKTQKQAKAFSPPRWFGKEITNIEKYGNADLAMRKGKP